MTTRLPPLPMSGQARDLNMFHSVEEFCRTVASLGLSPERKAGLDYIERFTPTMGQSLALAGVAICRVAQSDYSVKAYVFDSRNFQPHITMMELKSIRSLERLMPSRFGCGAC